MRYDIWFASLYTLCAFFHKGLISINIKVPKKKTCPRTEQHHDDDHYYFSELRIQKEAIYLTDLNSESPDN
jgi:hypothetical protein